MNTNTNVINNKSKGQSLGITYNGIPVQLNTLLTSLGSTQPWSNYC